MSGQRSDGGPSCCSLLVAIVCLQGAALGAIPRHGGDDDGDASRTYHVSRDDGPTRLKHVADIVDSLAMLGILGNDDDDAKPTCYTVDRIVKSRERADAGRTWRIGIFLYISEQSTAGTDGDAKTRHCVAGATSSVTDDAPRVTTENASSDAAAAAADNVTAAAAPNGTDADGQDSEPSQYSGRDNDQFEFSETKLSRTQVTVITACSIVIGAFFIVALGLRIRNYIRRYKRDERLSRRSSFQSSSTSMRHPYPHHSHHHHHHHNQLPLFKFPAHLP